MRRRRFLAWSLGAAVACAAGCGTGHVDPAGARARFAIRADGRRWARVGAAFATAARATGVATSGFGTSEGLSEGGGAPDGGTSEGGGSGGATRITVTGLPALAASELNNGQTLLDTATPLSRLTGDVEVVVVPANSKFRTFDDFGAHLRADPSGTMLAGGPQGEPDHLLFGLIAKGLGADTRQIDYTGYPGSREAVSALLGGKAAAAAGLLADWRAAIDGGRVRALAVSCAGRVPGLDVPTLLESGVRVDFADWAAAVGPEGMTDEVRESALRLCDEVTSSPSWRRACRAAGWISIPLSGDDFKLWLTSEVERTRAVLRDLGLLDSSRATTCWGSCGNGH